MTYKFELFLFMQKKKKKKKTRLINIKSFELSIPLILYIVLDIYMIMFFYDLFILDSSFSTLT